MSFADEIRAQRNEELAKARELEEQQRQRKRQYEIERINAFIPETVESIKDEVKRNMSSGTATEYSGYTGLFDEIEKDINVTCRYEMLGLMFGEYLFRTIDYSIGPTMQNQFEKLKKILENDGFYDIKIAFIEDWCEFFPRELEINTYSGTFNDSRRNKGNKPTYRIYKPIDVKVSTVIKYKFKI